MHSLTGVERMLGRDHEIADLRWHRQWREQLRAGHRRAGPSRGLLTSRCVQPGRSGLDHRKQRRIGRAEADDARAIGRQHAGLRLAVGGDIGDELHV